MEQPRSRDASLARRAATMRIGRWVERRDAMRTAGRRRRAGRVRCRCFAAWSSVRHRDHHREMRIWQTAVRLCRIATSALVCCRWLPWRMPSGVQGDTHAREYAFFTLRAGQSALYRGLESV